MQSLSARKVLVPPEHLGQDYRVLSLKSAAGIQMNTPSCIAASDPYLVKARLGFSAGPGWEGLSPVLLTGPSPAPWIAPTGPVHLLCSASAEHDPPRGRLTERKKRCLKVFLSDALSK